MTFVRVCHDSYGQRAAAHCLRCGSCHALKLVDGDFLCSDDKACDHAMRWRQKHDSGLIAAAIDGYRRKNEYDDGDGSQRMGTQQFE